MRAFFLGLFVVLFSGQAHAYLSPADRAELFKQIENLCDDTTQFGEIITYEGSLEGGAALKIVGVEAEGKINKQQWDGLEQLSGDFRTEPTICKFNMLDKLLPLFPQQKGSERSRDDVLNEKFDSVVRYIIESRKSYSGELWGDGHEAESLPFILSIDGSSSNGNQTSFYGKMTFKDIDTVTYIEGNAFEGSMEFTPLRYISGWRARLKCKFRLEKIIGGRMAGTYSSCRTGHLRLDVES